MALPVANRFGVSLGGRAGRGLGVWGCLGRERGSVLAMTRERAFRETFRWGVGLAYNIYNMAEDEGSQQRGEAAGPAEDWLFVVRPLGPGAFFGEEVRVDFSPKVNRYALAKSQGVWEAGPHLPRAEAGRPGRHADVRVRGGAPARRRHLLHGPAPGQTGAGRR